MALPVLPRQTTQEVPSRLTPSFFVTTGLTADAAANRPSFPELAPPHGEPHRADGATFDLAHAIAHHPDPDTRRRLIRALLGGFVIATLALGAAAAAPLPPAPAVAGSAAGMP